MSVEETLNYILEKYNIDLEGKKPYRPIEIPGMKRIEDFAPLLNELGFCVGAEIGVERGLYSEELCKANTGLKLFAVDPWQAYSGYRDHVSQEKLDKFMDAAQRRLRPYNVTLVRSFSPDAADLFDEQELDFVYIDANHRLECLINDIVAWIPKVRPGGIISGHDYRQFKKQTYSHVVEAVNAYTYAYRIHPWFLMGRKDEPKGVRDSARSWFWVRT